MRLMSTVPSQENPRRCLSESMSRSRWLSTGQTGTQEPHITHSSVNCATWGAISSEMVARLRSAMLTREDIGTGQARMQRSQPMHISISKRISSSVNGFRSLRCSIPTTRGCFFEGCICILPTSCANGLRLLLQLKHALKVCHSWHRNVLREYSTYHNWSIVHLLGRCQQVG